MRVVVVTGDRNWSDAAVIHRALALRAKSAWSVAPADGPRMLVVEGGARGADAIAGAWAEAADDGIDHLRVPARWDQHGKAAGPIRNHQMLTEALTRCDDHPPDVLAFHDDLASSKGTADLVHQARGAGLFVSHFTSDGIVRHLKALTPVASR